MTTGADIAQAQRAPESAWYPGRAVIVTRNDYALGLFNGDIGIALPSPPTADAGSPDSLRIWFAAADTGFRSIPIVALPPHATAFAMTVHQSQGSEFEQIALVLPATSHRLLSRELIYTAVTRARASVAVYAAPEVLAQAISVRTMRDSTLAVRLREYAQAASHSLNL
jgi:exodeoxyribonuclease V alpha subunit